MTAVLRMKSGDEISPNCFALSELGSRPSGIDFYAVFHMVSRDESVPFPLEVSSCSLVKWCP